MLYCIVHGAHRRLLLWLGVLNYCCYSFGYTGTEGSHRLYFVENK